MKHDKYTFKRGASTIQAYADGGNDAVAIVAFWGDKAQIAFLSNEDAAAFALLILEEALPEKANGDPASADYAYSEAINWLQTVQHRREQEAKSDEMTKRRDELARELHAKAYGEHATVSNYELSTDTLRVAIDRIIELESA